ncbi:MAG TPA: [protein-PII] uridylyltransferase [Burkholderiaceae bacterium]|nr:[protein-PII] uridylyltransferase [Burkholderiaceae bacterium]
MQQISRPDANLRINFRNDKESIGKALLVNAASTRRIAANLRKLSKLADETLMVLWRNAQMPADFALLAVGGFGRAQLFPHSDIDVLLLLPEHAKPETDARLKQKIESFISSCWDCGLEIGSSVRNVTECVAQAAADVTVQTSLLESRLIIGNKRLYNTFTDAFRANLDPKAFFVAKTLEMRQRHQKFENTPYSLEPNCKESPGGLRDLQIILWVSNAANLGSSWDDLAKNGLATPFEVKQIRSNEAILNLIRARLHSLAQRREDRLVFDLQSVLAESFNYKTNSTKSHNRASEQLMRRYYWAAKAVTQLNQILMLNIEARLNPTTQAIRPINDCFGEKAGMLEVLHDEVYTQNPHAILQTFLLYQTTLGIKGLSARTLRALYNTREVMNTAFRKDPVNRATFMAILQQPEGLTHAMRLMNQTSVLGRYLWVFRKIVGQMQHDLFHVYTVDQHILMVLRNMRRFFIPEHAHEYPLCSQLAAGWDKPWILYTAALFHDIAKGRGGDHSALGRLEVRAFCKQHGVGKADAKLIEFLVAEHLTMSQIAQKQDMSDPSVVNAFAKRVGNERQLTALYLLTVADIRGTSPKVWNAWKGRLFEDAYKSTLKALGGRTPDVDALVQSRKDDALVNLALHAQPFESHKVLWDTLDVSYFMRHDAETIAWHTRQLSRHVGQNKLVVRARTSPVGEGLQVVVYTPDQTDLFARICGYFDHAGFSILDAKIHTTFDGCAIDTFQVVTASLPEHYQELSSMLEFALARTIEAQDELTAPSRGRVSRRVKSFPITPRVELTPDEKAQRWLLNISASDRAGLLYRIALVLAQYKLDLQLAKITTLGERVEDTFLITGASLQHNKAQIEIETALLEAISD